MNVIFPAGGYLLHELEGPPCEPEKRSVLLQGHMSQGSGGHGVLVGVIQRVLGGAVVGHRGGDSPLEGPQRVGPWPPGLSSQLWRMGLGPFLSFPWFV